MKVASFSRQMLLKLIHLKSSNSGVTWSRFKYFPLPATFATKLKLFCTSYCSFSLHLPHIELQYFTWEKIRAFIRSILIFDQECSSPYLDTIEFHLTGSSMIWCDAQKKDDCLISNHRFWLQRSYALPHHPLWFETTQSVCWNLMLQKECIDFYLNSFSNYFYCTVLALFLGLSLHIFLTTRDY